MTAVDFEDPKKLAIATALTSLFISLLFFIGVKMSMLDAYPKFYWMCACSFLLIYGIFNSILSARIENSPHYWRNSIYMYAALAIVTGFIAYLFSGVGVYDAGSYAFIYIVVTFGYLMFISIMNFVKRIVKYAQNEVWLHPKIRKKK